MYDGCCCNCIKDVGWSGETRGFVWYTGMPPLLMSPTAILLYAGTMPGMAVCFSPEQNVQFHIPRSYQVIQDHRRDERFAIHCEGYPKIEDFFFFAMTRSSSWQSLLVRWNHRYQSQGGVHGGTVSATKTMSEREDRGEVKYELFWDSCKLSLHNFSKSTYKFYKFTTHIKLSNMCVTLHDMSWTTLTTYIKVKFWNMIIQHLSYQNKWLWRPDYVL